MRFKILPSGNCFFDDLDLVQLRSDGFGVFSLFEDDLLLEVLELLEPESALNLASCSSWFFAFASQESVWRNFIEQGHLQLTDSAGDDDPDIVPIAWTGPSWKATFLQVRLSRTLAPPNPADPVRVIYSDTLFRLEQINDRPYPGCLDPYVGQLLNASATVCPSTRSTNGPLAPVDRRHASQFPVSKFVTEYESENWPVIIENCAQFSGAATSGPASNSLLRSVEAVAARYPDRRIRCRGLSMPLGQFVLYARNNLDEMPLYLFDAQFANKLPALAQAYTTPEYFADNLFDELAGGPNYRWLICGGQRSGSVFHIDPNQTSAFNAVLEGQKYFLLFPPRTTPPGVLTDDRRENVTVPLSIWEWFDKFFSFAAKSRSGALHCILKQGDILFIPQGWWHCALNLTPLCSAITQNFCSPSSLKGVLDFFKQKSDQVSGFVDDLAKQKFVENFENTLRQKRPDLFVTGDGGPLSKKPKVNSGATKTAKKTLSSLFANQSATVHDQEPAFQFLPN